MNPVTMLLCRRFSCTDGGQTQIADTHAALKALSGPTRERIEGLATTHGGVNFPTVRQPLVVTSPLSRLPALLVGRHAKGVLGLSKTESAGLLNKLNNHCTRPEFVCVHYFEAHVCFSSTMGTTIAGCTSNASSLYGCHAQVHTRVAAWRFADMG